MVKSCFCYRSELMCNVHCLLNCRTVRIKITFKYRNRSFVFPLAKRALQAILVSHNVSCFVQSSIRSTGSTKLPFRVGIANISLIEIFPCRQAAFYIFSQLSLNAGLELLRGPIVLDFRRSRVRSSQQTYMPQRKASSLSYTWMLFFTYT